MQIRTWLLAAAVSAAMAVGANAQITGSVKLEGDPPEPPEIDMSAVRECHAAHADPVYDETILADEDGNLANVVLFIKTDDPDSLGGDVPPTPAIIDQLGCVYHPHVLPMMAGQELVIRNSDPFLHNVHSLAQKNPAFNFGQPNIDPGRKVDSPRVAENIRVKCDVHPWMGMWLIVLEHPFFAVTAEDGSFTIPGELPDDEYTLVAWHEKLGTQEVTVTVADGKAELDEPIVFKAAGATAEPADANVRLASAQTPAAKEGCAAGCCGDKTDGAAKTAAASK